MDIDDYADLAGTGFDGGGKEPVKPEEEFFHSVYISGKPRPNHLQIIEQAGKLQVRGVKYNLDEVNMIVTNVKKVLTKEETLPNNKTKTACFSYKSGNPPYKGTSGIQCGANSAERASNKFCSTCKEQIIVSGMISDENGKPEVVDGKPVFMFLRAKGMKYSNVGNYLSELAKMDLSPIITPVTDASKLFEKNVINNKRFVTKIKVGDASSQYGLVKVFTMEKGTQLSDGDVKKVLEITKKTVDKFNEKFDYSKRSSTTGYGEQAAPADNQFSDPKKDAESKSEDKNGSLGFEDINF